MIEYQLLFESYGNHFINPGSVTKLSFSTKLPPNNPLNIFVARSYIAFERSTIVFTPVEIIVQSSLPPSVVKLRIVVALAVKIL